MAYLSVEAAANELLLARKLGNAPNMPGLDAALAERLSHAWDAGADRLEPIEKADLARIMAGVGPFDRGKSPGQQLILLRQLRHELVHHEPIWVEHGRVGSESEDTLERKLCSKFKSAVIWQGRNVPFRWNGCLGAGCAHWAYTTARAFNVELYTAVGTQFKAADA